MKNNKPYLSILFLFALCVTGCSPFNRSSEIASSSNTVSKESLTSEEDKSSKKDESSSNEENSSSTAHVHSWGDWTTVKAATCTETGLEKRECSGCNESETRTTNALGHNYGAFVTTKEATCTEQGEQKKTCSRCGKEETSPINALGHDFGAFVTTKEATCTETGLKTKSCSRCDKVETETIPALGHDWDTGVITTPATEQAAGIKTFTCKRCKITKTESVPYDHNLVPVEPEITLNDVATANMQINFSEVTDNCMVASRVKTYVDAMEAQEKTLDRPYHFSSLYGPDDYAKIAAASDKGDGTTYAAADTGGVDVCQILTRNNGDAKNHPIQLKWSNGSNSFSSAKLKFWSTADQSDLREVDLGANATSASLANLYRARKYRAQIVTSDGKASQGFEFTTGDYPRTITMGNINNVRDLGGYMTSYGVRTTQGLIYRGYYIEDKNGGHGVNYTAEAGKVHEEVMKIGYELDLQSSSEINGRTTSCLSGASYKCLTLVSYENFLKQNSYQNLPEIFSILANADQKHVYFHCWGGADRTGMLAFFINAICGVSYTDLIEDFEITTETNNKRCHMHNSSSAHFPKFLNAFIYGWDGYDDNKTINENCEKWLLDVAGVSKAHIEKIREMMLPGYASGTLDAKKYIPTYTPKGNWQTDSLAHWKVAEEDENVKCNWGRHANNPCSVCNAENGNGSSSSQGSGEVQVLVRNWDANPTSKTNSDGKEFFQLTDTSNKVVGVKIAITNYTVESDASSGTALSSDGKIGPVNDKNAILTYKITAPKMGAYQMIMRGKGSSSGDGKTLAERNFTVKLNGVAVDIQNSRAPITTSTADFVAAPTINLTGGEDVIKITCSDYRIQFDVNSYIIFAEQ